MGEGCTESGRDRDGAETQAETIFERAGAGGPWARIPEE